MYLNDQDIILIRDDKVGNADWQVVVGVVPNERFQQISFVNGICTSKGGTHVDIITDQIITTMIKGLNVN
jgi:DNA topoisomerase II